MDPLSIVGILGTTVGLVRTCTQIYQGLGNLAAKYNDTNTILTRIMQETQTLATAVTQIQHWAEETSRNLLIQKQRLMPLNRALVDFAASLEPLEEEVGLMLSKVKPSGILRRKVKLSYIWNEDKMRDHLDNVRWQGNAIQLLLASTRLAPDESLRRMEGIAKAASHFREGSLFDDSGSTIGQIDFEFDSLLVNTAVYRRAFQQYMVEARKPPPRQPATISGEQENDVWQDMEDGTTLPSKPTVQSGYLNQGIQNKDVYSGYQLPPEQSRRAPEQRRSYLPTPKAPPPLPAFSIPAFWEALDAGNIAKLDELFKHPDFIDLNLAQPSLDPKDPPVLPLHHVIYWWNELKVPMDHSLKWLLEHGADPNIRSRSMSAGTAISLIVWSVPVFDQVKVAEMLVRYGADITVKNTSGSTALHGAVQNGALDLVRFLLKNGARSEEKDYAGNDACDVPFYDEGPDDNPIPEHLKREIRRLCNQTYLQDNKEIRRQILK